MLDPVSKEVKKDRISDKTEKEEKRDSWEKMSGKVREPKLNVSKTFNPVFIPKPADAQCFYCNWKQPQFF